jgi:hypothetical protein
MKWQDCVIASEWLARPRVPYLEAIPPQGHA